MTLTSYEAGHGPRLGYNKNAFAHKPLPLKVVGKTAQLIATPIGLISEAIHNSRDKKHGAAAGKQPAAQGGAEEGAAVELRPDGADQLIASGQAVPAGGRDGTHELVAASTGDTPKQSESSLSSPAQQQQDDIVERDEQDWALDEVVASDDELDEEELQQERQHAAAAAAAAAVTGGTSSPQTLAPPAPPGGGSRPERKPSVTIANPPRTEGPISPLRFPVVVPQRRPGTKTRGFVRAYAPLLADSDVSQEVFLQFLHDLHKNAQSHPVLDVITIATAVAGLATPANPIAGVASQAVHILAGIGQEAQERCMTNKFLERANREIFVPRGLFAMIVTYKKTEDAGAPEVTQTTLDLSAEAVAKCARPSVPANSDDPGTTVAQDQLQVDDQQDPPPIDPSKTEEWREKTKRPRVSSGQTGGEAEMPVTSAALIFPALEDAAAKLTRNDGKPTENTIAANIKTKAQDASSFVADYFDRRTQAAYAFENPDAKLATQMGSSAPQFRSRFADPTNHTNKHLFSLITGGKWKVEPMGTKRRWEKTQKREAERRAQRLKEQPRKRFMQEDVLYLMVVNMPSEAELEKAKKGMEEQKARNANG